MEDFPHTLTEFESRFSSEEDCREYLFRLRWPDGFSCPRCKGQRAWAMEQGRWLCAKCRHQASVTANTIFQDTHLPLRLWFRAMWYVTSQKNGVSAIGVQRVLGLGSYRSAWTLMQKLRRAMVRPGRERLDGLIEVDETYWGSTDTGSDGRGVDKALILIAAQADGQAIGRIRMRRVADASGKSLHPFIQDSISPGSEVITDGWPPYVGIEKHGYKHTVRKIGHRKLASKLLPRVHRVASLLKRWLLGTHQGAISDQYLDYYLDEFTFRFNRRKSNNRGKLFYRLVQQASQVSPAPYELITKPQDKVGG